MIKVSAKKNDAMTCMIPPTNVKKLKQFIGMVNFYYNVFPRQSHILALYWIWWQMPQKKVKQIEESLVLGN